MGWLDYSDDEVARFHPEFENAGNTALVAMNLDQDFEWIHHAQTPANPLIPDFVLRRRITGQWLLALELKRTKDAVLSIKNQVQESFSNNFAAISPCVLSVASATFLILSFNSVLAIFLIPLFAFR